MDTPQTAEDFASPYFWGDKVIMLKPYKNDKYYCALEENFHPDEDEELDDQTKILINDLLYGED